MNALKSAVDAEAVLIGDRGPRPVKILAPVPPSGPK